MEAGVRGRAQLSISQRRHAASSNPRHAGIDGLDPIEREGATEGGLLTKVLQAGVIAATSMSR